MIYTDLKAVLTGDLVGSSKLDQNTRNQLFSGLKDLIEPGNNQYDIFRGDSFQGIASPLRGLQEAIRIRAGLRNIKKSGPIDSLWDARIAIGIGKVEYSSPRVSESDGEAFRKSGPVLDNMTGEERLAINTPWPSMNEEMEVTLSLLDTIIRGWSAQQSEVVSYKLENLTQEEMSQKIGISQAAVNQRLKAASWGAVQKVIVRYQKLIRFHLSST